MNRFLVVLLTMVMGFGLFTTAPARAQEDATPTATDEVACEPLAPGEDFTVLELPKGEVRPAGTLIVEREVSHNAKTIDVRAVCLQQEVTISTDAWEGYPNLPYTRVDACIEAQRLKETSTKDGAWNEGYSITLEGEEVPQTCIPDTESTIEGDNRTQAEWGEIVPEGTIIVEREVNFANGTVNVRAYELPEGGRQAYWDTVYHLHLWYNYASLEEAQTDACQEARDLVADSQVERSWNEGFEITYDGKPVEEVCS